MVRLEKKQIAVKLRLEGYTYPFIKNKLKVSKSTLSYWFRNIELTKKQLAKIEKETRAKRIESYIKTVKERRRKVFENHLKREKQILYPIKKRDFLIAGLFLYLGEGKKTTNKIGVSNTNPSVIKFTIFGLQKFSE